MPDSRQHRGPHPEDCEQFATAMWPTLQSAVHDFSWLLSRGYASPSALKIVGDRFRLNERQRLAVLRSSCSDAARDARISRRLTPDSLGHESLSVDGFNVITTIEAALAGGAVIVGRDGCFRDMASMHGSYRKVAETNHAIELIGNYLATHCPEATVSWWLDRPVSNSGRLRALMLDASAKQQWNWSVELADSPDRLLKETDVVIATADGNVLDGCRRWLNLARLVVEAAVEQAWIVPVAPPDQ